MSGGPMIPIAAPASGPSGLSTGVPAWRQNAGQSGNVMDSLTAKTQTYDAPAMQTQMNQMQPNYDNYDWSALAQPTNGKNMNPNTLQDRYSTYQEKGGTMSPYDWSELYYKPTQQLVFGDRMDG